MRGFFDIHRDNIHNRRGMRSRLLFRKRMLWLFWLVLFLVPSAASPEDNQRFKIPGRFSSKTESRAIRMLVFEYSPDVKLILEEGVIHRPRLKDGEANYIYFFVGTGRVVVSDTTLIEGEWGSGTSSIADEKIFRSAFFCSAVSPFGQDESDNGWQEDKLNGRLHHNLQFVLKTPDKYFGIDLGWELSCWSQNEVSNLPLWVELETTDKQRLVYYLSAEFNEQLNIFKYEHKFSEPFSIAGVMLTPQPVTRPIEIDSTIIDITLKDSGHFDASCQLVFSPGQAQRSIRLGLPHLFEVDSVIDKTGQVLPFKKKYLRHNLYIAAESGSSPEIEALTIHYHGKFIKARRHGIDFPIGFTGWFPHPDRRTMGNYIINYTLRDNLTLLSVGEFIGEKSDRGLKTVSFQSRSDISYISFAVGQYDTLKSIVGQLPLRLFVRKESHQGLFNRSLSDRALEDLTDMFTVFGTWFGPPKIRSVDIVDQPIFSGQSSPGLIHLGMDGVSSRDEQLLFRSHEVAHQWWGHTVVPASLRDSWLSEGLAEYSSALYLKDHLNDTAAFDVIVNKWYRDVTQEGKIGSYYSRGYKAGPIIMGMRLAQSYSPGDYFALVYSKAAYLLRMLHFEIDGPDYRTDFFKYMLSDFCRKYSGQKASSYDFAMIAADRIGHNRAITFFNQWLYGWKIPSFDCQYEVLHDSKGRASVSISILVSEVDAGFETPYPVEIEFSDGTKSLFRLDGVGMPNDYILGPFPQEIKKVRFDPDRIILFRDRKVRQL